MKHKILLGLLFLGLFASAQTIPGYLKQNTKNQNISQWSDSAAGVTAYGGTPYLRSGVTTRSGQYGVDSVNHNFYFYSDSWLRLAKASELVGLGADSVNAIAVNNISTLRSIDYWTFSSRKKSATDKPFIELLGRTNPGDGGEGRFYYDDTATVADDGGMIFKPTSVSGAGRWKRILSNNDISIKFYGASATASAATNLTAVNAAKAYIWANPDKDFWLYFPGDETGTDFYLFPSEIKITQATKIRGDGDKTKLQFLQNTRGFFFQEFNLNFRCELKDLYLEHANAGLAIDSTQALIEVRCRIDMKNVNSEFGSGVGISLIGEAGGDSTTNPIFGSVAYSTITNCKMNQQLIGLDIGGSEGNHISVYDFQAHANRRWGIRDGGGLGNQFLFPRFDANANGSITGAPFDSRTVVQYGGTEYSATVLHDDGTGIGKSPLLHPTYWRATPGLGFTVWDTTKHYWSGGAGITIGLSANSSWYDPYVEDDQPGLVMSPKSKIDAGTMNRWSGSRIYANEGMMLIGDYLKVRERLGIGLNAFPLYSLDIEDSALVQMRIISRTNTNGINLINSNNPLTNVGGWRYIDDNLYTYTNSVGRTILNASYLAPVTDNDLDLGVAVTQRWKNIIGVNFLGKLGTGGTIGAATMTLGSDGTGDVYYRNSSGLLTRLGVGSNGDVLTLASGLPSWAAGGGGGGTPAGNYGNIQLNRNGAFDVMASDSLNIASGILQVKGYANIGNATYDATTALTLRSPTDVANEGLKIFANNLSQNIKIGYAAIETSGGMLLTASGRIALNTVTGVRVGDNGTPTEKLDVGGNIRVSGAFMPNNLPGTAGQVLISQGAATAPIWDSTLKAGTFIPTITGTSNLAASTSGVFEWTLIDGWYDVTGEVSLDPTTTTTLTVVRLSLPVSSSIPSTFSLIGFASDDLGTSCRIRGDTGNNEAEVRFTPIDVTNRVFSVRFRFKFVAP